METRLKKVRSHCGYTQDEAAKLFNVSIQTYRNWEQGRVVMNANQLLSAAKLFNTSVDYILMFENKYDILYEEKNYLDKVFFSISSTGREILLDFARLFKTLDDFEKTSLLEIAQVFKKTVKRRKN